MKKLFSFFTALGIFFSTLAQAQTAFDTSSAIGAGADITLYQGQQGQIHAWGGTHYEWIPSAGLDNDTLADPMVTDTTTTTYVVKITVGSGFVYDTVTVYILGPGAQGVASCINMVSDGDFEAYTCTSGYLSWQCCQAGILAAGWQNAVTGQNPTIDLFSSLSGGATNNSCISGAPYNGVGTETPHAGNSYGGLILYQASTNYYEYFQQMLPCSLLQYQRYGVSFWSAFADYSNYTGQSIGLLLTQGLPAVTNGHILSNSTAITAYQGDTTVWKSHYAVVYGNNENWVTIGNFKSDPMNHIQSIGNNNWDYNYIDDVNITPLPPDILPLFSTNTVCLGMGTVPTLTLQAQGSPAQYCDWYDQTGSFIGHGSPITVTPPASAGTYTYTCVVTLPCVSCSSPLTSSITITVLPLTAGPTYTTTANPNPVCYGQSSVLTVGGAPPGTTYVWNPLTGIYNNTQYTDIEHSDPSLNPGVYTYSISTSGCVGMGTVTFTVNPLPTFTITPPFPTVCTGQSNPTLTATNGSLSYTWAPTSSLTPPTSNTISVVAHPTVTTVYLATGTDSYGCQNVAQATVTIQSPPTLTVTSNGPVCAGTNYTITASGAGSGGTYTINPAAVNQSVNGSGVGTFTVTASPGTTYTITGASAGGCVGTATITPGVFSLPNVTVSASPSSLCVGQTTTLTATGGASPSSSYTWAPSGGSVHTSTFVPSPSPTVTTAYTVTAQDNNGCINSAMATVTVNPLPPVPTVSPTLCANAVNTLTVTNAPGFPAPSYSWATPSGANAPTCVPFIVPACTQVTINNPSGVYTVTASYATGCSASATVATVAAPNVTISTAPTNSICASSTPATFTLTAGGASTYTWSTSATTSSITPSVTTTTSYSVTGTAATGCKNPATTTITVIPTPTVSVSAGANPLCQGLSTTLTASGATNYTWTPSGTLSSSTGTAVTASPTATTTYTVTGTTYTCAPASAVITLTVIAAPSVTITPSYQSSCNYTAPGSGTICAGGTATLTANSGGALTTYTWMPGALTGSVVAVSPTVTTVYTVSGTGSTCSGSKTYTLNVSNCNCPGTALPVLTNTTLGSSTYATNSNTTYTVTGNVTLNSTVIKMGSNTVIYVPNGSYLQLRGAHLSACYNMWQGIVVDPGGRVDVVNNSLVEDAIVAIDYNPGTAYTGTLVPTVQVNGATFNCNNTAIRRAKYESATTTNYTVSAFKVNDAVITCRCGIPFPIPTSSLTVYSNTVTSTPTFTAPDLSDYYSVANYTVGVLKPPMFNAAPFEGIHLENIGVPLSSSLVYLTKVGGTNLTLFDNLTYGINVTNATLMDTNSAYQNPVVLGTGTRSNPYNGGYGINAINTSPDWYNGLYVNNSRFIKMARGINSSNYYDFDINHNTLWGNIFYGSGGSMPPFPWYTETGINLSSVRFIHAYMDNNNLADMANGIVYSVANTSGYNGGNGQYVGDITANSNTVAPVFPGNSYSSRFINTAIAISNVLTTNPTSTLSPVSGSGSTITVKTNSLTNVWNGIYMSNHQWQKVRDEQNNIALAYQPTSGAETDQYGIQHANCFYGTNYGNDIFNNTVTGYFASTYTFNTSNQSTFEKKRAIWSRYCGNHYVTCNSVNYSGRGFEFEGQHFAPTYWAMNTMTHSGEAFALTNSGAIGTQSTTTNNANDNQWLSTTNTYAHTYTDASSNPSGSILWLQSNMLPYGPTNNQTGGTQYTYPVLLVQPKSACTYSCSLPPSSRMANSGGIELSTTTSPEMRESSAPENDLSFYEQVVLDSIDYPAYYQQNAFINKYNVYRVLRSNPTLLDSSQILSNFYNSNSNSSWALFSEVEDSLSTSNSTYAAGLLVSYSSNFSIEQNYKRFYEIYIDGQQRVFTSNDSIDLIALANSCPMLNGVVVFQARALRNILLDRFENYTDNCPEANTQKAISASESIKKGLFFVYPNPTNGKVYISGFATSAKTINIEILDVAGKVVLKQSTSISNGIVELALPFNNGIYFIKIINEDGMQQIQKIIINK